MKKSFSKRHLLHILFLFLIVGTMVFLRQHQSLTHRSVPPYAANTTAVDESGTACKKTIFEKVQAQKKKLLYNCTHCSKPVNEVLHNFTFNWTKNEGNHQKLRSLLIASCNGFQKAAVTQNNSPLGTLIEYDGEKRTLTVNEDIFNNFPKDSPFSDKMLDTCAVVGNGGILANSSCGESIDSAQFVIRCNIPPLEEWHKHVGKKTDLVTANPTIFVQKYGSLKGRRREFMDKMSIFGNSLLFLPAFSFAFTTSISLTVHYTLEDFRSPLKSIFMNPHYLRDLDRFWRSQGVKLGWRMSSGFMMVSLALELCNNINVYGFWPFDNHPHGFQPLTQHYYDDKKPKGFHKMSVEFDFLVKLHNLGVLKLHLGECLPESCMRSNKGPSLSSLLPDVTSP